MDLNPDLATFVKSGGFGFGLDLNLFLGVDLDVGLDLSFFKTADLDLDLKIGLDLDLDLNITGFAHHCMVTITIQFGNGQILIENALHSLPINK